METRTVDMALWDDHAAGVTGRTERLEMRIVRRNEVQFLKIKMTKRILLFENFLNIQFEGCVVFCGCVTSL